MCTRGGRAGLSLGMGLVGRARVFPLVTTRPPGREGLLEGSSGKKSTRLGLGSSGVVRLGEETRALRFK